MNKPFNKDLFNNSLNEKYRSIIHNRAKQLPKKFEEIINIAYKSKINTHKEKKINDRIKSF